VQRPQQIHNQLSPTASASETAVIQNEIKQAEISGSHGGEHEHRSSGTSRPVAWLKLIDVSEVLTASIIRTMVTELSTSETSANFNQTTRHNIPEDCNVQSTTNQKNVVYQ
jgi:hypothetical protein